MSHPKIYEELLKDPRELTLADTQDYEWSSDDEYTVYIGDGNSDKDAAQYCDFIFAKDGLARFCSMERISFYPFRDFNEVRNKLTELMLKKNLRKRHQAQLKRKSAYMAE